ncbi:unnamed protein product [Closterium sp. NIES-64]|nr:unnamed protein product [Closterium sp. NIES-64]
MGIAGYMVTLEMKDYKVIRVKKAEFTEACFDLGLAYELDRLRKSDRMALIRGASLRAARMASKPDYLVFGSAFRLRIPRHPPVHRVSVPRPHCSILLVVRPGDLLLPDEEEIGTFYRHLDPKTSSKRHEEKAANVLRQEVAGKGLLAVNALAWSLEHLDDVHCSYDPLIVENPKLVGLKALRLELVQHVEKSASNSREAASTVGRGIGTGIALGGEAEEAAAGSHSGGHGPTDGGEEEHEREDGEGGGEQDRGSDEEGEDKEREEDNVVVTGKVGAVQFAGEKVADKSGGSGHKSGKKARGSSGSTPTRIALKAAADRMKAAERENKKLTEEKLVAEKRLEYQTARIDALFGVVTAAVNKLSTVAESVTSHEQTSGRSLQTAVDAMRAVVQEAVSYRGSTLEFMNSQWLPTVRALHLTATAAQCRRHEDDVLLLRGVADALAPSSGGRTACPAGRGGPTSPYRDESSEPASAHHGHCRVVEEAGGVDEEILASIMMPDREIEVMREKLQAAALTVGAQQGTPAASTAPAEDHIAAGAKSPPGHDRLATSEIKFGKKSRYICRSMDKSEVAYCIAVAVSSYDGFVSDVILNEFGGVKEDVMAQYKADWNVARLIPGGMWTVMWSRGANVFRDRFQEVVAEYNRITGADRAALMLALRPAVWFGDLPESTEPEKAAKNKVASGMIAHVLMCAAFAPVAAKVTPIPGVGSERLSEILAGTACAVWCFSETNATAEVAAGEGGAAATVRGASKEFAKRCKSVIEVVLQRVSSRKVGVEEVADTVTKDLHGAVLRSLPEDGDERDHVDLIARVMIENLAFWGDCCVGGPKLKARGVNLPLDAGMKAPNGPRARP